MSDTRAEDVGDASDAESDEVLFRYKIHDGGIFEREELRCLNSQG